MAEDFAIDISKWCDDQKENQTQVARAIVLRLIETVQERTPVLTGRLRASWGTDIPVGEWEPGEGPITIQTNVVYAARIEYGFHGVDAIGRHYNQEGRGMVASTVNDAPEIAQQVIEELSQ